MGAFDEILHEHNSNDLADEARRYGASQRVRPSLCVLPYVRLSTAGSQFGQIGGKQGHITLRTKTFETLLTESKRGFLF
jgi:hypothetical protein